MGRCEWDVNTGRCGEREDEPSPHKLDVLGDLAGVVEQLQTRAQPSHILSPTETHARRSETETGRGQRQKHTNAAAPADGANTHLELDIA